MSGLRQLMMLILLESNFNQIGVRYGWTRQEYLDQMCGYLHLKELK